MEGKGLSWQSSSDKVSTHSSARVRSGTGSGAGAAGAAPASGVGAVFARCLHAEAGGVVLADASAKRTGANMALVEAGGGKRLRRGTRALCGGVVFVDVLPQQGSAHVATAARHGATHIARGLGWLQRHGGGVKGVRVRGPCSTLVRCRRCPSVRRRHGLLEAGREGGRVQAVLRARGVFGVAPLGASRAGDGVRRQAVCALVEVAPDVR